MQRPAKSNAGRQMKQFLLAASVAVAVLCFVPDSSLTTSDGFPALATARWKDKAVVRDIYLAMADVIERDGGDVIVTTEMFRDMQVNCLRLAAGKTDLKGKYKDLAAEIEEVFAEFLSLDNVAITPELRAKIVAACRKVAAKSG
jgi:hypothetical protein